jgi:chromosome segregation ATPase
VAAGRIREEEARLSVKVEDWRCSRPSSSKLRILIETRGFYGDPVPSGRLTRQHGSLAKSGRPEVRQMLDELNRRLIQTKERLRSKQKLEAMLAQVQTNLRQAKQRSTTLTERLASEKADVDKLEGLSLTGLFYSVLGTKTDHLDKEKEEYLAAKLKYDECVEALDDLQAEADRLQHELEVFQSVEQDYERLIKEKESLLASSDDPRAESLLGLSERLTDLKSDQKELAEAVQAGESALGGLRQVQNDLQSAANWGTWDMLGGGMLSTMAKHSKIDSARQNAHAVQRQLRRFQEELADAGQRLNVSLEIGGFSKFADYFFDGLIADWNVQSKIRKASSACSSAMSRVSSSIGECRQRLADTQREHDHIDQQRRKLVEQA